MGSTAIVWTATLMLFLGGLGLPVPENPLLMGCGYALRQGVGSPLLNLAQWYGAILGGDALLFAFSGWMFSTRFFGYLVNHHLGAAKLERYRQAFGRCGGLTLFLARFTFGARALAYVAAGLARYPWRRFLLADASSVALQVVLFVGIGYRAGEHLQWAQATATTITMLLAAFAVIGLGASWLFTLILNKVSGGNR